MPNLNFTDEWGGIDEKIKGLVAALNSLDIPTTSSCEGHVDHGSPSPWIKVRDPKEPEGPKEGTQEYEEWQAINKELRQRTEKLLAEFYDGRSVPEDVRIVISDANAGFWLHSGGEFFKQWRKDVALVAERKMKGEAVDKNLSVEEISRRAAILPAYQKEMGDFASFLSEE